MRIVSLVISATDVRNTFSKHGNFVRMKSPIGFGSVTKRNDDVGLMRRKAASSGLRLQRRLDLRRASSQAVPHDDCSGPGYFENGGWTGKSEFTRVSSRVHRREAEIRTSRLFC